MKTCVQLLVRNVVIGIACAIAALPLALPQSAHAQTQSKIAPALLAQITANPLARMPVIVEMNPTHAPFVGKLNVTLAQEAVSILQANGHAIGGLPIVQGAAGYANAEGILAMSVLPQVATIEHDAVVRARRPPASSGGLPSPQTQIPTPYAQNSRATEVWQQGGSGNGVTVAVLDSGVAVDPDLGDRVLSSVGFAGNRDSLHPDLGGHGTHVAGVIAGNGAKSDKQFVGMAPRANIVDVQVLDHRGNGRYSSVLAGLGWVLSHKYQFGIKIVNLSFGAPPSGSSYRTDPLAAGVEIAWRNGLVVVAAAGNRGPSGDTVESPESIRWSSPSVQVTPSAERRPRPGSSHGSRVGARRLTRSRDRTSSPTAGASSRSGYRLVHLTCACRTTL
jgi:subtilisin family serine protease